MYFKDAYGRMWLKTVNGFQNIGIKVTEKTVTFRKVDTVKVIPSPVVVPTLEGAVPLTLRQAVSSLGITEESPLQSLKNLNNLESQLAYFLGNFDGDTSHAPATVLSMLPYFQPDEQYMGNPNRPLDTDKVDKLFWSEYVRLSSSEVFDDPDNAKGTPKAQYFFGDVKALAAFIDKMTAGVEGSLVENVTDTILANCPEQYGAIYRNYKATGEMLDLNGSNENV